MTFDLGDGELLFVDPRRFGTGELALGPEALDAFFAARLGLEPFEPEFTGAHLHALAKRCRAPIKAMLLDQKRIAGVGNIYADEALFRARVHPLRRADQLTPQAVRGAARRRSSRRCRPGSRPRAPRSTTSATPTASAAPSRTASSSTCARASRASAAAARCASCAPRGAGPTSARSASRRPRYAASASVGQGALAVGPHELLIAAERLAVDDDLGERHHAGEADELGAALGVAGEVDLLVGDPALGQQGLRRPAVAARLSCVHLHPTHYFT